MLRRLWCLVTGHQGWTAFSDTGSIGGQRHQWQLGLRVIWMDTCLSCGLLMEEGSSDEWVIPYALMDEILDLPFIGHPLRES